MIEPKVVAQRALDALPDSFRNRPFVTEIARRVADEVLRYGHGTLPLDLQEEDGASVVRLICEDLEGAFLLSDQLSSEEEDTEEITPEQRMEQLLDKAQQVEGALASGESLQQLIRQELADTDCGACDHPTCDLYSIALANGKDPDNDKCEPGGPKVTAQVELVMRVANKKEVDPESLLAIEAKAKDEPRREGGLRVLEIGTGRGFPAVVFSLLFPDVSFEIVEPDLRRSWFLKRLMNMLGVRNVRVRVGPVEGFWDELSASYDMVLVKHTPTAQAVEQGVTFARPGGVVVNWQDADWSPVAASYQIDGPGRAMPLAAPLFFTAAPVEGSVLLTARRPGEPEAPEAPETPAETDDSVAV